MTQCGPIHNDEEDDRGCLGSLAKKRNITVRTQNSVARPLHDKVTKSAKNNDTINNNHDTMGGNKDNDGQQRQIHFYS